MMTDQLRPGLKAAASCLLVAMVVGFAPAVLSAQEAEDHAAIEQHDLSHGNSSENLTRPDVWRADLAIYTFVVFFLLLAILFALAWKPIMQALEEREQAITGKIEEARASAEKAAEQMRMYEAKLAAAQEETREMLAEARRDAESTKERIIAEAREGADRERQRAVADIERAKQQALGEISQKSVDLALGLAGQIVRREVSREEHNTLIRDSLNKFPVGAK